jgi:hypothetical protein
MEPQVVGHKRAQATAADSSRPSLIHELQKAGTPPRIRVNRYYVKRYWGTGGGYETPLSCLHARFTNDPNLETA